MYNRRKLVSIAKKINELSYVEEEKPFDMTMQATGSTLNLYLKTKRSSQINALVGFLPNSQQLSGERKLQLTVDANVLWKNPTGRWRNDLQFFGSNYKKAPPTKSVLRAALYF